MNIKLKSLLDAGKRKLVTLGLILTCCYCGTVGVYCGTFTDVQGGLNKLLSSTSSTSSASSSSTSSSSASSGDDVFTVAESAVDSIVGKLVSLGTKLFPLALVICIISLFITHDERKLGMEIKILITLCIAYALLLMIDNGIFTNTVTDILNF